MLSVDRTGICAQAWLAIRGHTVWWPAHVGGDLYMQNADSRTTRYWRCRATVYGEFDA